MECEFPISIKLDPPRMDATGQLVYWFPSGCGKCLSCLMKRKSQWSLRMVEEMRNSFSAYFVTLTYNEKFIPYGDDGYTGNIQDHKHFIKWLKYYEKPKILALRSCLSEEELKRQHLNIPEASGKLKYYGVNEYGERYSRPHLHYILFNIRDINNCLAAWSSQFKVARGHYKPDQPFGRIQIDECNVNTIDYVLKYMVKPPKDEDPGSRMPEKSFMSKGLGLSLMTPEIQKHIAKPDGNSLLNVRGSKVGVPRYYQKKFLDKETMNLKTKAIIKLKDEQKDKQYKRAIHENRLPGEAESLAKLHRSNTLLNTKKRKLE